MITKSPKVPIATDAARGKLIFQTSNGKWSMVLGLCATIAGPAMILCDVMGPLAGVGVAAFATGIVVFIVGVRLRRSIFRCYRRGVESRGAFVSYEDVKSLKLEITGASWPPIPYVEYHFTLVGRASDRPLSVRFHTGRLFSTSRRARLLFRAATAPISKRMFAHLDAAGEVPWCEGIVLRSQTIWFHHFRREVGYSDLDAEWEPMCVCDPVLVPRLGRALELRAGRGFRTRVAAGAVNSYPGYAVLLSKMREVGAGTAGPPRPGEDAPRSETPRGGACGAP
jgi:hypothetical protein